MITENLSTLKIHKLTQEQYDRELAAGRIDENALYLTPYIESGASDADTLDGKHADAFATSSELTALQEQVKNIQESAYDDTELKQEIDSKLAGKAPKSHGIHYIEGTGDTAGTWLGTHEDITEYYPGLVLAFKIGVAGLSGGTTLNINNLGAVTVVKNASSAISTNFAVNSVIFLVYTVDSDGTAYWKAHDYDSNTKTTTGTSNKTSTKLYLTGATSQSSSGTTTYSNKNVYIDTDNCLYSNGKKVATSEEVTAVSDLVADHSHTITEADLDAALAEKVNAASDGNHSHANKAVLDTITATKVSAWDAKSDFSGNYNDLTNKPTIPSINGLATETYVNNAVSDKVVKVDGKGLSTNDYTTAEKTKLSGIEAGAQVNTITGVKGGSETNYRTGNVNITKANIGLGNVDNTADANKTVKHAGSADTAATADKVGHTLTVGSKIFNGASDITINASDLGLEQAMKFLGSSSTAISDGSTTGTITVNSKSVTAAAGNVVLYNGYEYVWTGSAWEQLGQEGSFSLKTHTHTVSHTPAGSVSQPTFTGTEAGHTHSFSGSASHDHSFTGTAASHKHTFTGTGTLIKATFNGTEQTASVSYTPAGSVSTPTITVTPNTTTVNSITAVGTLPSLSYTADTASKITAWSAGSVPSLTYSEVEASKITDWSAGTAPSLTFTQGSLPSASLSGGSASLTGSVSTGPNRTATLSLSHSNPTLTFSAGTLPTATFSAGSVPSLTYTTVKPDNITAWSAGSVPSLTYSSVAGGVCFFFLIRMITIAPPATRAAATRPITIQITEVSSWLDSTAASSFSASSF